MTTTLISQSPAWTALKTHQHHLAPMRELFAQDPQRFQKFSLEACGLFLDYSKNRLTEETLILLRQLAEQAQLSQWITLLYQGDIVNNTEQRAALHIALRNRSNQPILFNGQDVMPQVNAVLARMQQFTTAVRNGQWRGYSGKMIETIVNIGIGGSDLGPAMVTRALKAYHHPRLRSYFISNVDSTHLGELLPHLDAETTLFIVASKTFSTQETLLNARSARHWLVQQLGHEAAVAKHFVAVSTHQQRVREFGIDVANMFEFWDWVGGRYSLWSAIGLPITVMIGMEQFEALLSGAHELDQHFKTTAFAHNLPVLLGLIEVWYSSFLGISSHAILPYDHSLELLPAYLQQLIMESLGKRVTRDGIPVDYPTCPIIWGALGNNGQHAFYQLLHQGAQSVSTDFIVAVESQQPLAGHQHAVLSNALAQTHTLMNGRNQQETQAALASEGLDAQTLNQQLPHRLFPGNQPSNTLIYQKLTPKVLGSLIALYEHKVFVESVCWSINPFDQWGVELGKQVAHQLMPQLSTPEPAHYPQDSSTEGLMNYLKTHLPQS